MAYERELKLALRPRDAAKLMRHPLLAALAVTSQRVVSRYFDTPDRLLGQAGIAVRVRRDGATYLATVKCEGGDQSGFTERSEWEVELPSAIACSLLSGATLPKASQWLEPLLAAIDQPALRRHLTATAEQWQVVLTTQFRRTRWQLPLVGDTAEIALDRGHLIAGDKKLPICEVEIESASAPLSELYALARRLADEVPLWPEPRSKAARGAALLAGTAFAPVKATPPIWSKKATIGEAFWQAWSETVAQGAANLSLYTATHDPEALHQLRVALRRARVLLRLFAPWLGKSTARRWQEELGQIARTLGGTRDRDVLLTELFEPALAHCPVARDAVAALYQAVHEEHRPPNPPYAALGRLWLDAAVAFTLHRAASPPQPLRSFLAKQMERFRKRVVKRFTEWQAEPSAEKRHRVRIALKAWRYALEWTQPLLPKRVAAQQLARAKRALDLLGAAQDWESARVALEPFLRRHDLLAVGAATLLAWHHPQRVPAADQVLGSVAEWLSQPLILEDEE